MGNALNRLLLLVAVAWGMPCLCPGAEFAPAGRRVIDLDQGWRFHQGRLDLPGRTHVTGWRYHVDPRGAATDIRTLSAPGLDVSALPWKHGSEFQYGRDTAGDEWKDGGNAVAKGAMLYAWIRTELPGSPASRPTLEFESVQGIATVFVNGVKNIRHEGRKESFSVDMRDVWRTVGTNSIAVLVESVSWGGVAWPVDYVDLGNAVATPASQIAPGYDDRGWDVVDVPHDYVVQGPIQNQGADGYHRDIGWYRKVIDVPTPAPGDRVWLEFDGISRMAQIWVNGTLAATHPSAYAPCRIDATGLIKAGGNTIVVRCDSRNAEGWWYDGGGIYRHVRMVIAPAVHVVPDSIRITSVIPTPGDGVNAEATVTVDSSLGNGAGREAPVVVRQEILDSEGQPVAGGSVIQELRLKSGNTDHRVTIPLTRAKLWSCEHPAMYTLRTTITGSGTLDRVDTTFGIRTAVFDPDRGFLLNGQPVKLKGTCNHENHAGVGIAIPDRLHAWRLEQLKKMGGNAIRCSHNEYSPVVYDLCDRLGILVMDEFREFSDCYLGKTYPGVAIGALTDQRAQVRRNRNHPSIIIWSLCNEEGEVQGRPEGAQMARVVKQMVDALDGTRPTTAALNGGFVPEGVAGVTDVVGINYNIEKFDAFRALFPGKPIVSTEACSEVSTRGYHDRTPFPNPMGGPTLHGDKDRGYLSTFSENGPGWWRSCEVTWKAVAERPWVAGCFVWTGFDYKGEPTPFSQPGQPSISSSFGILDSCGFPKDSYWYYRSWWTDQPTVHVFPHWNWAGKEGQEIPVWVHSNAEEVELFLNGTAVGRQKMARNSHLEWKVPYTPGRLEARGYFAGKVISDAVETAGTPAGITLSPDRINLRADGDDLAWIGVGIVDGAARLVPTASDMVRFSLSGPGRILGVGNGDSSSHDPDKSRQRAAFHGRCMVLVQTIGKPGDIVVTAEGSGIGSQHCTLTATATP